MSKVRKQYVKNVADESALELYQSPRVEFVSRLWKAATTKDPNDRSNAPDLCKYCTEFTRPFQDQMPHFLSTVYCKKQPTIDRKRNEGKDAKDTAGCCLCCTCKACHIRQTQHSNNNINNNIPSVIFFISFFSLFTHLNFSIDYL